MPDDREVVRDEQIREVELLLQLLEQVDDLRLDRDVERGDGLVGDDEVRVDRDRAGEADALALSAGELVRVTARRVGGQADDLEQVADLRARLAPAREAVGPQRLADDAADAVARVERRERILEDHLHPPAQRPQLVLAELGDVLAVEEDPAARSACRGGGSRAPDRRFAAAGLADEPERLAAVDRQRDAVDGLMSPTWRSRTIPLLIGK